MRDESKLVTVANYELSFQERERKKTTFTHFTRWMRHDGETFNRQTDPIIDQILTSISLFWYCI